MKKSAISYVVFPAAFLLVYWEYVYFTGHEIEQTIPRFSLLLGLLILIVLEQLFHYEKFVSQKQLRVRDLSSTIVNVFFTTSIGTSLFLPVMLFFPELFLGRTVFFSTSELLGPVWLQFFLAPLVYSFLRYGIHRVQHTIPFLWELHSYHHSVTDLQASNTFVSHPLDFALRNVLPPVILGVIGFDPTAIVFGVGLATAASLMSHCGAGLHASWLNKLFVTPEVHRWHHTAKVPAGHKYSVNYGVGLVLWDQLFGTYYLPEKEGVPVQPEKLGHPGGVPDEPNYLKLFFLTRYLPRFIRRRVDG